MNNYFRKLFEGRIDRTDYLGGLVVMFVATWIMVSLGDILDVGIRNINQVHTSVGSVTFVTYLVFFCLFLGLYFLFFFSLNVRRLHDWGHSGWWSVLIPIVVILVSVFEGRGLVVLPIMIILNLLVKGQSGVNKYGEQSNERRHTLKILFRP